MDIIKNTFRMCVAWFTMPLALSNGSRKLNKWDKKNKKNQDPSLYPFDERIEYHRKKMKGLIKRFGVKVEVIGGDNIPRGGAWIVANHTSNLDGPYLSIALGHRLDLIPIARDNLKNHRWVKGYFTGIDGMFLDRTSPRQALNLLDGAAQYSKQKNRAITIFPEGSRSLSGEPLEFKNGLFKFPQKYFLPILPVTILGTLEAKNPISFRTRTVKVIVHKPIKPIEHSKIPTNIISRRIRDQLLKDLENWKKDLSEKELKKHNQLSVKGEMKRKEIILSQEKNNND